MAVQAESLHGLLVMDKPTGVTSRDVVNRAQKWFPRRTRIGHTGTLDPLATGVLVLCVGNATRLTEYVQNASKVYRTTAFLGATSDTDDAGGEITPCENPSIPDLKSIQDLLPEFLGEIIQIPPAYSALRVGGKRAHQLARKGKPVPLEGRPVRIDRLEIRHYKWPKLELEMQCGKGTYVRSVVRDLGERLGCGGYVQVLRRESIGSFTADQGLSMDAGRQQAWESLLPMRLAVQDLPDVTLGSSEIRTLCQGNPVPWNGDPKNGEVAVLDEEQNLIAIAKPERDQLAPSKVLQRPN